MFVLVIIPFSFQDVDSIEAIEKTTFESPRSARTVASPFDRGGDFDGRHVESKGQLLAGIFADLYFALRHDHVLYEPPASENP